jgi:hypothetical protein
MTTSVVTPAPSASGAQPGPDVLMRSVSGAQPDPDALLPTLVMIDADRGTLTAAPAATGIDVRRQAPQTAVWLAQHGLALRTLDVWLPSRERARTRQALLLANALQRHPLAPALLRLIRRALNRLPELALRAEARRQARGLTVEAAAAEIGIPVDACARYVRSGRGLTQEQRARVAAWAPPDAPGKFTGEALHAVAPLEEIAACAGMTPDAARTALETLIADLLPPLRAGGLLDGVRVLRSRPRPGDDSVCDLVHVWVSPDPPAERFFTRGWLQLLLADRLRALAPQAETLSDLEMYHPNAGTFGVALLTVCGKAALVVEPMTRRDAEERMKRLHRLRDLAPLLVDGDPRRLVVVLAPPDDSPGMGADHLAHLGETFGVTITDLANVDAALRAALQSLSGGLPPPPSTPRLARSQGTDQPDVPGVQYGADGATPADALSCAYPVPLPDDNRNNRSILRSLLDWLSRLIAMGA